MKTWDDMLEQMEKDTAIPEKVRERYTKTLENLPEIKKVKKIPAPVKAAVILLGVLALAGGGVYAAGQTKNIQWFCTEPEIRFQQKQICLWIKKYRC